MEDHQRVAAPADPSHDVAAPTHFRFDDRRCLREATGHVLPRSRCGLSLARACGVLTQPYAEGIL